MLPSISNTTIRGKHNVCEGMSVIATVNIKDKNIFNTMEFKIDEIDTDTNNVRINCQWYENRELAESFIPSFCVTVYKYQGADNT